jgi:hypothetical protein
LTVILNVRCQQYRWDKHHNHRVKKHQRLTQCLVLWQIVQQISVLISYLEFC